MAHGAVKDDVWELYTVDADFSEANDLAAKEPAKLKELQAVFLKEAVRTTCSRSTTAAPSVSTRPLPAGSCSRSSRSGRNRSMKRRPRSRTRALASALPATLLSAVAGAQTPGERLPAPAHSAEELAKKLSNPVPDVVSIPFQLNRNQASARTTTSSSS